MSQAKIHTAEIDGVEYRMRPLPPRVALKLLKRILTIAAPGVGGAIDDLGGNVSDVLNADVSKIGLGNMISGALDRMTDADLDWVNDLLSKQCEIVRGPNEAPRLVDVFDAHFQGRIRHWFSWVVWATKMQFADFFDDSAPNDDGPPR